MTRSETSPGQSAPVEIRALRGIGIAVLLAIIVTTALVHPRPGLDSPRAVGILAALVMFLVAAIGAVGPGDRHVRPTTVALVAVGATSAALAALQPRGLWVVGGYFVAITAARLLRARTALLVASVSLAAIIAAALARHQGGQALGMLTGCIPWFLVMRTFHLTRLEHLETRRLMGELERSRAAEADAAAAAERGRLAREMHDVLAHSLSALALQLETTRLLARERGADPEIAHALDRAHGQAAAGLDEARRAIGALRGEDLPGPDRLGDLAAAFEEQAGVPVELVVAGTPRDLPAEARVALYRTAQEALTNVRRHATPERVALRLEHEASGTRLVVEDHARRGVPAGVGIREDAPSGGGYGLTGMRERAELLGGQLQAGPTDTGFRVELWLPA